MRLAGKVAIVTGAASGMGAATARMFAREGAKVVIADVLEHEGRQVADAIGAAARYEKLDVTDEDNWAAVVAATTGQFGRLDPSLDDGLPLCIGTRKMANSERATGDHRAIREALRWCWRAA